MSAIQKNVEASSAQYASTFTQGHIALPPAKKYLVLTCMDARIDPARAFGIDLGDAHVIRNVSWPCPLYSVSAPAPASAVHMFLARLRNRYRYRYPPVFRAMGGKRGGER